MASVADLKAKLAEAMKLHDRLRARAALAQRAGMGSSYQAVIGRFTAIADRVKAVTQADSFTGAVKALWSGSSVNGLGVLPLLAPLAIAGLVTLLGSWLVDAYALDKRLDAYESQLSRGVDPAQAAKNVAAAAGDNAGGPTGNGSLLGNLSSLLKWGAVIATAAIAGPPIVRALEQRKGSK